MFATIPSSTDLRLGALAHRIYRGGPDMVLRMMRATLIASDPMMAFERIGASALPAPTHLIHIPKPRPALRLVK